MRIVTKIRLGFVTIIFLALLLAYTGFLGVMRVKYAFYHARNLSTILYDVFLVTHSEDLYLLTKDKKYQENVRRISTYLSSALEEISKPYSDINRFMYFFSLAPGIMRQSVEYYSKFIRELVSKANTVNQKLHLLWERDRLLLDREYKGLKKLLTNKGYGKEAQTGLYLLRSAFEELDPKKLTKLEDLLLRLEDKVSDRVLRDRINSFMQNLREVKLLLVDIVQDLDSYYKLSGSFYRDVWKDTEDATAYTNKAIVLTMVITTLVFLVLAAVSVFIGYKFSYLLNKYFNQMIVSLDEMRKGHFSERVDYEGEDEFGVLAREFNDIMQMLQENIEFIIGEAKEVLSTRVMGSYRHRLMEENPLFVARRVVEALVDLNRYKSVI
jgi:hypothetical protein